MDQIAATPRFRIGVADRPEIHCEKRDLGLPVRERMVTGKSVPELLPLCESFFEADGLRMDIDERIMALSPDDPHCVALWQELEAVLVRLGDMFSQLAHCAATNITELRAKAAVLTIMQQFGEKASGPIMPEEQMAFALSLADNAFSLPEPDVEHCITARS